MKNLNQDFLQEVKESFPNYRIATVIDLVDIKFLNKVLEKEFIFLIENVQLSKEMKAKAVSLYLRYLSFVNL